MNTTTYSKLDPEFKAKWIAAMRSGEYQQTNGELYDECTQGFCCIGVAAELCGASREAMNHKGVVMAKEASDCLPPPEGFPEELTGGWKENPLVQKLVSLNDGDDEESPTSFPEIADWIDANL